MDNKMAKSKRRFTNFFYILVTLFLVLVAQVQSSEDVTRVRRRMVAMCPPGFQKIRTECYHISPLPLTWLEAHFECKGKNGKLAEPSRIQDAAIRKFLLNKYPKERDEIFLGGMFDHRANEWSWGVSGKPFNYSSFIGLKTYLKRNSLNHTCTVYNPNRKYRWTPRECTENHRFICEHKMPKVSEKNRDKVYQRWNVTYPNSFANEVVMEVRDDDRYNNSRRVKVVSASGEDEFYLKRTTHPPNRRRNDRLPLLNRPTYNTPVPPTPQPRSANDVLSDAENNEVLKPTKNPKKDRTRSKFDREVAKQRRLERSRQRAAKKEERQRRLREKEELRKRKEEDTERRDLEQQREREEAERKRLHEERIREQEERRRLEDATRREEEERRKVEDTMRHEEEERQKLEDERQLYDQSERRKRLKTLVGVDFIPEVITEDYKAIEQKKIEKQKEVEKLEKEIQDKYNKEQEEALALQKMEQEKHIKELEEKELARRAEDQKRREDRENERKELVRQAEEAQQRIQKEMEMDEERRKEEEEYQKRLDEEKAEGIKQEKEEKARQEKEKRERDEEENRRKAELQKKIDSEKDDVIEGQIKEADKLARKMEVREKFRKLSPEQRKKFLELKKQKRAKQSTAANEATHYDKK